MTTQSKLNSMIIVPTKQYDALRSSSHEKKQKSPVFIARGNCRDGSTCRFVLKLPAVTLSKGGACLVSNRDPDMRQCNTIDELVQLAYDHLDNFSSRGIAAFWSLMVKHVHNQRGDSLVQLNEQLDAILDSTMESIGYFSGRDLATTTLGLAKLMKGAESHGQRSDASSLHRRLHTLLIGINSENKQVILGKVAKASLLILSEFDARCLSNLIYSVGLSEYIPMVEDGRTILDVLALEAMSKLQHFNSQDLSNMLWSYAKVELSNSLLFKAAGDVIMGMNDLSEFQPQHFSNILWSYATAGQSHPRMFHKFADHIVAMKDYRNFLPQHFSNIAWAYATAGVSHPQLFSTFAKHIVLIKDLRKFLSQHFSNILWAYVKVGKSHPQLFCKFANHIVAMKDLGQFKPQDLSNIVWAYATAGKSHPLLFQKVALVAISRHKEYNSQSIANLLWAYATVGLIDQHLFTSFAPAFKSVLSQCSSQDVANIAWAYAVANVNDPVLLNTDFVAALQAKANDFGMEECRQLHQWQLWQVELKSGINLPPALREDCRQAFVSQSYQLSRLQDDVVSVLSSIGLRSKEEELTSSGYRLDALVEVNGEKVGIEVDEPYHFMNQELTGSTLLKHRQVNTLDGIHIVSVPYWEWNKLGNDHVKKQQYLRINLGLS
jgi:hypothetical protein